MRHTADNPSSIYLDHAATTPMLPDAVDAMAEAQRSTFGNPSSGHGFGAAAKKRLEDARGFLTGALGATQVVFTSGGSEADLLGTAGAAAARPPGRVLMGAADHPAVLAQQDLLGRLRQRVSLVPTDALGCPDPERFFELLGKDVRVVALLYGHNELGSICELDDLVESVRRVAPDAHVHVDLVQAFAKVPFDMAERDVDSVAISAHKFGGPRGVGLLGLRSEARLVALQPAGGQEEGLRGGTENVAGAVAMAKAAEHYLVRLRHNADHTEGLAERLEQGLRPAVADLERLGASRERLPHVLSLRLPGIQGQTLLERARRRGLAFSIGSACHEGQGRSGQGRSGQGHSGGSRGTSGDAQRTNNTINPVLAAIGLDARAAREVVRFSFGPSTTHEDIEEATAILLEEIEALRAQAPRGRRTPAPHSAT